MIFLTILKVVSQALDVSTNTASTVPGSCVQIFLDHSNKGSVISCDPTTSSWSVGKIPGSVKSGRGPANAREKKEKQISSNIVAILTIILTSE